MLTLIVGALLAIIAAGLLATIIVKLVTTVGQYIIDKVRKWKQKIATIRLKKILDEINRVATAKERARVEHELSPEDVMLWMNDENDNVIEDSIEIIKKEQVDNKTRKILDDHDGLIYIDPLAV